MPAIPSITYSTAIEVCNMWDEIKCNVENYEIAVGERIYQRLFESRPEAMRLFGVDPSSKDQGKDLERHAVLLVDMIDCVVQFLGPNMDALEDFLIELGARHVRYGVHPDEVPAMVDASIDAIEKVAGDRFKEQDRAEWTLVFSCVRTFMIKGMVSTKRK